MLVVDLELSGIDPSVHGILSIGAVDFIDPERQFYGECKLREGAHVMEEALEINGFTEDDINDPEKESEEFLLKSFMTWIEESENHTLAGHNVHLDLYFLENGLHRAGMDSPLARRVMDLHSVCLFHMLMKGLEPPIKNGRSDLNSDTVMEYVGMPAEPRPHIALNGALWEAEAFSRLIENEGIFEEFEDHPVPWVR